MTFLCTSVLYLYECRFVKWSGSVLKGCLTLRLRRTKELVLRWMSHCSWGEQSVMVTILFEKTVRMKKRGSPNEIDGVSSTCRPDFPM